VQVQVPLWEAQLQDNCWVPILRCRPFSLATNRCHPSPQAPLHHPSAKTSLLLDLRREISHDTSFRVVLRAGAVVVEHCAGVQLVAIAQRLKRELIVV